HTRKLVPLADLLAPGGSAGVRRPSTAVSSAPKAVAPAPVKATPATIPESRLPAEARRAEAGIPSSELKDKLLAEIRSGKATFYNTVVAQAQRIDVIGDRITFVFGPAQSTLRGWFDQQKAWLDAA